MAENCAILKYHLHRENIAFDVIPPSRVKKLATGKGNAKKGDMYAAWLNIGGEDIETTLDTSREANPISDLVDSYFVLKARSHHLTA